MSGATAGDGIFYLTKSDIIDPVAESASQASTIQAAFDERELLSHFWKTAADRTAEVNMTAGDLGMQQDTGTLYLYTGASFGWRPVTFGASRTLGGSLLVTPSGSAAPYAGTGPVTFPTGFFTTAPFIQTSPYTSVPLKVATSANNVTSAGFTAVLNRNDSATATTVFWTATQI